MKTILFFLTLFFFASCDLMAPINPDWVKPIDPEDPLPLECEGYEPIQFPLFVSFTANLDLPMLVDSNIYYQAHSQAPIIIIDPATFFDTVFYSGVNIAGIKSGTSDAAQYNDIARMWVMDGSGHRKHLSFISQSLHFRGAVKFVDCWELLPDYRSAQFVRFTNSGYTCEQIIQIIEYFIYECYQTPDFFDLREISIGSGCIIPDELVAECELRGSTVWQ